MLNAYVAGLTLGSVHAVEVDHMVAVSVFAGLKPRLKAAASYGARWGLGHAAVVVLVGGVLAWSGIKIPTALMHWSELAVGLALIALGYWAFRKSKTFHLHPPKEHDRNFESHHGHLHAHGGGPHHHHGHAHNPKRHHQHLPTAMGALHGLAGSAPVLALIPITLLESFLQALVYLVFFSLGTTLAMTVYAAMAAAAIQGLGLTAARVKTVTAAIAGLTMVVGAWWVGQAFLAI